MPDPYLHGNGEACHACADGRFRVSLKYNSPVMRPEGRCTTCHGTGKAPLPTAEIVARTVEEARRIYWPQWERRVMG